MATKRLRVALGRLNAFWAVEAEGVFTVKLLRQCNGPMRSKAAAMQEMTPSCGGRLLGGSESIRCGLCASDDFPASSDTPDNIGAARLDRSILALPVATVGSPASVWISIKFALGNLDHACRVSYENVRRQRAVK